MANAPPDDSWNQGDPYERYVGRWSSKVADEFLRWLDRPTKLRWLDVGCGTGALTAAIARICDPAQLTGIEPSEGFLAKARERLSGKATLHVANAQDIPLPAASVDVVVSGLVLNFVPNPAAALVEMKRVTTDGGTIACYVWDYAGRMDLMRYFWDVAVELNPDARALDEGVRFPLCNPDALLDAFQTGGLLDVTVVPLEIDTGFRNFDDYWQPFLGGQGPAPAYAMSLREPERVQLRERIRARLPIEADDTIALRARAWGVRAGVPARPDTRGPGDQRGLRA